MQEPTCPSECPSTRVMVTGIAFELCDLNWSGAKGTRTPGLLHAMQALYQLSYSPSAVAPVPPTAPRQCTRSGAVSGRR